MTDRWTRTDRLLIAGIIACFVALVCCAGCSAPEHDSYAVAGMLQRIVELEDYNRALEEENRELRSALEAAAATFKKPISEADSKCLHGVSLDKTCCLCPSYGRTPPMPKAEAE